MTMTGNELERYWLEQIPEPHRTIFLENRWDLLWYGQFKFYEREGVLCSGLQIVNRASANGNKLFDFGEDIRLAGAVMFLWNLLRGFSASASFRSHRKRQELGDNLVLLQIPRLELKAENPEVTHA